MAKTGSVQAQVAEILGEYSEEVREKTNEAMGTVSKECVSKLKNTSPHRSGKYAKGWTTKKERQHGGIDTVTVHNKTAYQLTHLLENGHVVRNKKGTYGRTRGIKHIKPVEDYAINEFPAEIERKLK